MVEAFDDYLGLASCALPATGALVFCGESGAGKSTYINWLVRHHPDVCQAKAAQMLLVVDEIDRLQQLDAVRGAMTGGPLVLVASHLPGPVHLLLRLFGRIRIYNLSAAGNKLVPWLQQRDIPFSEQALVTFRRRYGANYTNLDVIVERYPGLSLGAALGRFRKECTLDIMPNPAKDRTQCPITQVSDALV